jgi:hypothetical protein
MEEKIDHILAKGKEYSRVRYKPWNPKASCYGDNGPFWAFNGPAPELIAVKAGLLNCAGLINVLRRELGLEIPGATEQSFYAGGTYEWYVYLDSRKKLGPFYIGYDYPRGTLLLRRFHNELDDGHLAIVSGKNTVLHSIHGQGVCETEIRKRYYDVACLPKDWLQ